MSSPDVPRFPRRLALALVAALSCVGCGYTSEYVAPLDGRARAVWKEDNVVAELSGGGLPDACARAIAGASQSGQLRLAGGTLHLGGGFWAPRYYGPSLVVVSPGLAPSPLRPPVFIPAPHAAGVAPSGKLGLSPGGGGGGGGGGHGDLGKAAIVLAVIALLVLPAVDVGLALSDPESPARSSQAIDQVNAYNDLARTPGSPCAFYGPSGDGN